MQEIERIIEMLNDRLDDMETALTKKNRDDFYRERGLYTSLTSDPTIGTLLSRKDLGEVTKRYRDVNDRGMQIFKDPTLQL